MLECVIVILVQVQCCQPTSQHMVSFIYMDESGTLVITSAQLTRSCSCEAAHTEQLGEE